MTPRSEENRRCAALTPASLARGIDELRTRDRQLDRAVREHGSPPLWGRRPGFATLVRIVLEQQVSLASGAATYDRLRRGVGRVTPARILAYRDLRKLGLTRQKSRYCRELSSAVAEGRLDLRSLEAAPEEAVRRELTAVVGIGVWTADVYLLMALRRPDVWPRGDLALYQAFRDLKATRADRDAIDARARRWRPWRSVAARILWNYYLGRRRSS